MIKIHEIKARNNKDDLEVEYYNFPNPSFSGIISIPYYLGSVRKYNVYHQGRIIRFGDDAEGYWADISESDLHRGGYGKVEPIAERWLKMTEPYPELHQMVFRFIASKLLGAC